MKKHIMLYGAMGIFLVLFFAYTIWLGETHSYSMADDSQGKMSFVKGKVIEIAEERLSSDPSRPGGYVGEQDISVKILNGKHKGDIVSVTNYVSTTHHIQLKVNDAVMLGIDEESGSSYVFQYYRLTVIYVLIGLFVLMIIIIGRKKGLMTVAGLAFSVYVFVKFTLPLVYFGSSPIVIGILSVAIITTVSLVLLTGISKKTLSAIISTSLGVILSGVIYAVFSELLHVNGYNISESDAVLAVSSRYGLQVYNILYTGILIASLGAVMDVAMSVTSALYEMIGIKESIGRKELFTAGMNMGKDMIGTMTNTLILAFAGGSFVNLIIFASYNMSFVQLMTSDFIVIELLQGIACTAAVVLAVPISAWTASCMLVKK
ncbi:MAG: YibE/F family protein [Lachnospiraceae bacterium]|nr:YibE/F family protein [Lachnospiraceae bacterium]